MQEAKEALDNIQHELSEKQQSERKAAKESIQSSIEKLKQFADFAKLNEKQQTEILAPFENSIKEIEDERFIGNIRSKAYNTNVDVYQRQLEKMLSLANPPLPTTKPVSNVAGEPTPTFTPPKITFVRKDSVKINFKKPALETKQDVEEYLTALREQYFRIIDEDKRISL